MSKQNYLIGTRGSLLAVTQCSLLKEEIESKTDARFDLKTIKTEGDQKTEKPLWQLDGKDFFTKELDAALLQDQVDMVVHSYKDLGSERPEGLELAAVGKRKFAHDILLVPKSNIAKIKDKAQFIVGTSSPRRIANTESSLKEFLPNARPELEVKCSMLRGNVNTRIQKLLDGNYDAIVLALAGLERLASKEDSKKILEELLKDLTFLVLPQKSFPSSASQGALAVEVHDKSPKKAELLEALKSVHSPETVEEIKRERKAFNSYGGGCHLAVGIHVKEHKGLFVHVHKGSHQGKEIRKIELEGVDYSPIKNKKTLFVLGENDKLIEQKKIEGKARPNSNLFVTSSHCFHALGPNASSIWASGSRTHKKLASLGHWVNGSADGFGHEEILAIRESKAVSMMLESDSWQVLSHKDAQSPVGEALPCYERTIKEDASLELDSYDAFYWGSFTQYEAYIKRFPEIKGKVHACGLGKTYDQFVQNKISVLPVADMKSFKDLTAQ